MTKISRVRVRSRRDLMLIFAALCVWTFGLIFGQELIMNTFATIFTEILTVPNDISCYREENNTGLAEHYSFPEDSIFIISSTCNNALSLYESCAIESMINGNKGKVHVLVTNPLNYLNHEPINDANSYVIRGYEPFKNNIHKINIDEFVKGTPVEGIFTKTFFGKKSYRNRRVREVLKLAALYRFGGVVIDLEMLVAEPKAIMDFFSPNGVTKVGFGALGGPILALNKKTETGRRFLEKSFEILNKVRNDVNIDIGVLMTTAYLELCLHEHYNCSDLRIIATKYFYPINMTEYYKYYEPGDLIPDTVGYYIWEKNESLPTPGSLYWKLMEQYCPNVHDLVKNIPIKK